MQVLIKDSADQAVAWVAAAITNALRAKPSLVLGLATGRTMESVYAELVRQHREQGLDFGACRTFNLDEYLGLAPDDANSYHYYMDRHLFSGVNLKPANTRLPLGNATDPDAECDRYEQAIRKCGGIDLQLLGIGLSGHIGFNEPLSAFTSRTRVAALAPATLAQNGPLFGSGQAMPAHGMTMGVGTILDSRRCILLATGADKAEILARAVEGPLTSRITASALQWHADCTIVIDAAAASRLEHAAEYRAMFG